MWEGGGGVVLPGWHTSVDSLWGPEYAHPTVHGMYLGTVGTLATTIRATTLVVPLMVSPRYLGVYHIPMWGVLPGWHTSVDSPPPCGD